MHQKGTIRSMLCSISSNKVLGKVRTYFPGREWYRLPFSNIKLGIVEATDVKPDIKLSSPKTELSSSGFD